MPEFGLLKTIVWFSKPVKAAWSGFCVPRKLERLTVEGNVHLHGFAFLWGHCQNLKYMKIGKYFSICKELLGTRFIFYIDQIIKCTIRPWIIHEKINIISRKFSDNHEKFSGMVVSNELTNTNVLIQDVFNLLFQVEFPVLSLDILPNSY